MAARRLPCIVRRLNTVSVVEQLQLALSSFPNVSQLPSRFGSRTNPAWSVAGREFAHLHTDTLLIFDSQALFKVHSVLTRVLIFEGPVRVG